MSLFIGPSGINVKLKITKEEFQRAKEQSPLDLYYQGIRAKETKEKYTRTLRYTLCNMLEDILEGDFEQRVSQLVKFAREDQGWARDLLLNISKKLRERTRLPADHPNYFKPSSMNNYFKPLKKLFDMNDVTLPWKRIYSTFPELDNISTTRGWTKQEIQKMLKFSKGSIDRAVVLVASSSGIRSGGFGFSWGDITPVYRIDNELRFEITESQVQSAEIVCAMIIIYRGTYAEYPAFITPEAYHSLMDYKNDWVREVGREPKQNDPVFKKEGTSPQEAQPYSLKKRIVRMIQRANLRTPLAKGHRRYEVPTMNGFRRFWNKSCKEAVSKDSPLASLIKKEYMMGHSGLIKLDRNYFQAHAVELAEEYLNAVPHLTISDEDRVKAENFKLQKEKSKLEQQEQENQRLEDKVARQDQVIQTILKKIDKLEPR